METLHHSTTHRKAVYPPNQINSHLSKNNLSSFMRGFLLHQTKKGFYPSYILHYRATSLLPIPRRLFRNPLRLLHPLLPFLSPRILRPTSRRLIQLHRILHRPGGKTSHLSKWSYISIIPHVQKRNHILT